MFQKTNCAQIPVTKGTLLSHWFLKNIKYQSVLALITNIISRKTGRTDRTVYISILDAYARTDWNVS